MCGIAGIFSDAPLNPQDLSVVQKMTDLQRHRGPDDSGTFSNTHCILGHRRLAIIDLSPDGHQPFASDDDRYQMVYNGEIYNYIELRQELKKAGCIFRTKTDTEVLLKAYLLYGAGCLEKLNGMFAFAIYDTATKQLFIARDRVGVKPFYYAQFNDRFYFASEIKAFTAISGLKCSVNNQAVFDYLAFNRTDIFDETFTNEIKRLPKGHYAICKNARPKIIQWWNPEKFLKEKNSAISFTEAAQKVENILVSAVQLRMRSDVPVGSCLSGGLDSSIITGILFQHHNVQDNYSTFTASFPDDPLDETRFIDALNQRYSFVNHRTFPNADTAFAELEKFVYANDEPVTNPSFYSQYQVMRLAKENGITVLLDGQGGDENFAGYQYFHGFYMYGLLNKWRLPALIREMMLVAKRKQDKSAYQTLLFQMLPGKMKQRLLLKTLPWIHRDFFYEHIEKSLIYKHFFDAPDLNTSLVRHFQYKLEHLLRMEDRNSMAFSIEARVPYLDYRLVEFALNLPDHYKIHKGETKYLQKKAAGKYTIPEILNRKDKIGFGTPTEAWMNNENWRQTTANNVRYLQEIFPFLFTQPGLPALQAAERWKMNQLAVWHSVFVKQQPTKPEISS